LVVGGGNIPFRVIDSESTPGGFKWIIVLTVSYLILQAFCSSITRKGIIVLIQIKIPMSNQINVFEYVSILISIILGLGITQILSSFSDLLYKHERVRFYWPHIIWIFFILFLHVQDWFVTYNLKNITVWYIPQLMFVLLYPIFLFMCAKMLLPTNDSQETADMKQFYMSQFPIIFLLIGLTIFLSVIYNIFLLKIDFRKQIILFLFFTVTMYFSYYKPKNEILHQVFAVLVFVSMVLSTIIEKDNWVIK
jgi:hypothetical protein